MPVAIESITEKFIRTDSSDDRNRLLLSFIDESVFESSFNESDLIRACAVKSYVCISFDQDGFAVMRAWSDSKLMRGILCIMASVVTGLKIDEIANIQWSFMSSLGLGAILTPNRRNGMREVLERIRQASVGL